MITNPPPCVGGGHGVVSQIVRTDDRDTGVGLAHQGAFHIPAQLGYQIRGHHIRGYAVKAHGCGTGIFQLPQDFACIPTGEQRTVRLHREGVQDSACTLQLCGGEDGFCLPRIHQRFRCQQVCAALHQSCNLVAIVFHQQVKIAFIKAVGKSGQGGQIAGHQAIV